MRVTDTKKEMFVELNSVRDMKKLFDDNNGNTFKYSNSYTASYSFTGTDDFDDFLRILDTGSVDIMKSIKKVSREVSDRIDKEHDITNEFKFDVTGDFFDVGIMLSGEPEHWLQPIDDEVKPRVEINVNASYSARIEHSEVIRGASEIIGIVMSLEKTGIEVKLNLNFRSRHVFVSDAKKLFTVSMVAKDYGQGFDYKKLSSLLHTSTFRRGVFRIREILVDDDLESSYGRSEPKEEDTVIYDLESIKKLENRIFKGKDNGKTN